MKNSRLSLISSVSYCAVFAIALPATPLHAQEASEKETTVLEPIIVKARKRPEHPKDVPFSMSILTSDDLSVRGNGTIDSVSHEVPGLNFTGFGDPKQSYLSIRGLGPITVPLGPDDTSVVTYIDGVPQPLYSSDLRLMDVTQIEVLRGPQGTLFGRNAQAGVIDIKTADPSDTFEAEVGGEVGTLGHRMESAMISGPMSPDLSGRLSASWTQGDGNIDNIATGKDTGGFQSGAVRGKFLATPADDTTITLSVYGQRDRANPVYNTVLGYPGFPVVSLSPENDAARDVAGAALTVEHEFDNFTLTSVTGASYMDYHVFTNNVEGIAFSNLFGLPIKAFQPNLGTDVSNWSEREKTFDQEFRLSSKPDSAIGWVAGANFHYSNFSLDYTDASSFFPTQNGQRVVDMTTRSYAAFGEATVPLADRLKASFGLRYTHDDKDFGAGYAGNGFPGTVASFSQSGNLGYDLITGRGSLSYDLTDASTIYATIARGAKSGGFPRWTSNASMGMPDAPYESSTSWSYEIGAKNEIFDGRGFMNVSAFYNDVKDEQLMAIDSMLQSLPVNIDTKSYGFEIEGGFELGHGFGLAGNVAYTHAELANVDADTTALVGAQSGNRVPNVPRVTTNISLTYDAPADWIGISNANLYGYVSHQFVGERSVDVASSFDLASYHMVNAKIGLKFDKLDVYAFANDIFDQRPQLSGAYFGPGANTVYLTPGRTIGVGAKARF